MIMAEDGDPTICILENDESVRKALLRLMRSAGVVATSYASVDELLGVPTLPEYACIIADIRMQGTSGLALPGLLAKRGLRTPVIFVSAQDTEETRAEAKRAGAAAFFRKPVDDQALLDTLAWVVRSDNHRNHA